MRRWVVRALGVAVAMLGVVRANAGTIQQNNLYCVDDYWGSSCQHSFTPERYGSSQGAIIFDSPRKLCFRADRNRLSFDQHSNEIEHLRELGLCPTAGGPIMPYCGIDGNGGGLTCANVDQSISNLSGIEIQYTHPESGYTELVPGYVHFTCPSQNKAIFSFNSLDIMYDRYGDGYLQHGHVDNAICDFSSGWDNAVCTLTDYPLSSCYTSFPSYAIQYKMYAGSGIGFLFKTSGVRCSKEFQDYFNSYIGSNAKTGWCSGYNSWGDIDSVIIEGTGAALLVEWWPQQGATSDCRIESEITLYDEERDYTYTQLVSQDCYNNTYCMPTDCPYAAGYFYGPSSEICNSGLTWECLASTSDVFSAMCQDCAMNFSGWVFNDGAGSVGQRVGDLNNAAFYVDTKVGTGSNACRAVWKGDSPSVKTQKGSGAAVLGECYFAQ